MVPIDQLCAGCRFRRSHALDLRIEEAISLQISQTPKGVAIIGLGCGGITISPYCLIAPAQSLKAMRHGKMQIGGMRRIAQQVPIEWHSPFLLAQSDERSRIQD